MVGPAHMMFTEDQNNQLMRSIDFESVKEDICREPPQKMYKCRNGLRLEGNHDHRQADPELFMLHTEHPPLFGYRYNYAVPNPLPQSDLQQKNLLQPEHDAEMLNSQHCLNDMVLLQFNTATLQRLQDFLNEFNSRRCPRMVEIKTVNKLKKYNRPGDKVIQIAVKNFTGRIVNNLLTVDAQRNRGTAHDILFTLDNG